MLLQAYDFAHLHRTMGVELQMGGADQWGNITAGLELIRRTSAAGARTASRPTAWPTSCCSSPSGTKFGKSEAGDSVWLDPARTSPYAFYQYWLNTDDRDVGTYLRWFTELPRSRSRRSRPTSVRAPGGPAGAARARARHHDPDPRRRGGGRRCRRFEAKFSNEAIVDPAVLRSLFESAGGSPSMRWSLAAGTAAVLAEAGLVASKGEARRMIAAGGSRSTGSGSRTRRSSRSRSPGSGSTFGSASAAARSAADELGSAAQEPSARALRRSSVAPRVRGDDAKRTGRYREAGIRDVGGDRSVSRAAAGGSPRSASSTRA